MTISFYFFLCGMRNNNHASLLLTYRYRPCPVTAPGSRNPAGEVGGRRARGLAGGDEVPGDVQRHDARPGRADLRGNLQCVEDRGLPDRLRPEDPAAGEAGGYAGGLRRGRRKDPASEQDPLPDLL